MYEDVAVVTRCYEALKKDCDRISVSIKVDARKGPGARLDSKVKHVQDLVKQPLRT